MRAGLKFRGAQGTTGTQASFMEIFQGDAMKIDKLNDMLCEKAGFPACYEISTQTYTRKVDLRIANALSALGATAIRIATVSSDGSRITSLAEDPANLVLRISVTLPMIKLWMSPMEVKRLVPLQWRTNPIL